VNFIIYDLEATCWRGRPPKGVQEIIEIGAYKVNQYGEILEVFDKFVRPDVNTRLSRFCTQLTSITQQNVDSADKFPKVAQQFIDWIDIYDTDYTFCTWGSYDKQLLTNDCVLHKMETEWLDNHINIKDQYHNRIKKVKKHGGLKATVKKEGFEFTGIHHRAIADAENLTKIFIKYVDEWLY